MLGSFKKGVEYIRKTNEKSAKLRTQIPDLVEFFA
jgi:hypothetical protein